MVINMFTTPERAVKIPSPVNPIYLKDANRGKMTQVHPSFHSVRVKSSKKYRECFAKQSNTGTKLSIIHFFSEFRCICLCDLHSALLTCFCISVLPENPEPF